MVSTSLFPFARFFGFTAAAYARLLVRWQWRFSTAAKMTRVHLPRGHSPFFLFRRRLFHAFDFSPFKKQGWIGSCEPVTSFLAAISRLSCVFLKITRANEPSGFPFFPTIRAQYMFLQSPLMETSSVAFSPGSSERNLPTLVSLLWSTRFLEVLLAFFVHDMGPFLQFPTTPSFAYRFAASWLFEGFRSFFSFALQLRVILVPFIDTRSPVNTIASGWSHYCSISALLYRHRRSFSPLSLQSSLRFSPFYVKSANLPILLENPDLPFRLVLIDFRAVPSAGRSRTPPPFPAAGRSSENKCFFPFLFLECFFSSLSDFSICRCVYFRVKSPQSARFLPPSFTVFFNTQNLPPRHYQQVPASYFSSPPTLTFSPPSFPGAPNRCVSFPVFFFQQMLSSFSPLFFSLSFVVVEFP